ncbi:hypothetical protein HS125_02035 [bacterium]|nr:hypothetical protein [bacterium]
MLRRSLACVVLWAALVIAPAVRAGETLTAGILSRTLDFSGGNLSTTQLSIDGVPALAEPSAELAFTVYEASPNERPVGLLPGEGAEVDLDSGSGTNVDTLTVRRGIGIADTTNVAWVRPVRVQASAWSEFFQPPVHRVRRERGSRTLVVAAQGRTEGPLAGLAVTLHYTTYRGHPALRKWVEITNAGPKWRKLEELRIDDIGLRPDFLHAEL